MIVVDYTALSDLQKSVRRQYQEIESIMASLVEQVTRLRETWSGASADGFRQKTDDWLSAASDLHDQLATLNNLVATAHDNHASAVRAGVSRWRGAR